MNKKALLIPRPGATASMVRMGYSDALKNLGWTVYICDPESKLGCRRLIEDYGIALIMTHSRYGVRQLPVSVINDNEVAVCVEALPLNPNDATMNGPYESAHDDEPEVISRISKFVVHTPLEPHTWSKYMAGWMGKGFYVMHLPVAGNMVRSLPPTYSLLTDVAMVANFGHRQEIMKELIAPLFKRLHLLGYSYQAFGDRMWELAGVDYNGPLTADAKRLAHIYGTAKVCPNVHTKKQVSAQAYVNERAFMIPLCGGIQVTDNPLIYKYLESHCEIATGKTDFMNKVIGCVEDSSQRFRKIRDASEHVSKNNTYFNRLSNIFEALGWDDYANEIVLHGERAAVRHCWELDARLSAEERGVPYAQGIVEAA